MELSYDASIPSDDTLSPASRDAGREPALTGCPWHDVNEMLQTAGLRPTRQRMALGWLLFGKGARHLTAEMLYEEATLAKVPVSLATVYNTLNQLTDAGLLRQVSVDGTKTYFDTNVSAHHHFYLENNHELVDIHRISVEGMEQNLHHLRGLIEAHVRETGSRWGADIVNDFRTFLGKFWLVKPKAAAIDTLIENLRRAA